MQNLNELSDSTLLTKLETLVSEERKLTLDILKHLQEIERRQLFAREGFSSLFEWCVKKLAYSEASALRRIDAMRIMTKVPELESKIEDGSVQLSQLSQVQSFFRIEKKKAGKSYSIPETLGLLTKLEGCSTRETERKLLCESPVYQEYRETRESIRPVSNERSELKVIVDDETLKLLEEAKSLLAHNREMNPSMNEIFKKALVTLISSQKKTKQAQRSKVPDKTIEDSPLAPELVSVPSKYSTQSKAPTTPKSGLDKNTAPQSTNTKKTRFIPVKERRLIFTRAKNRCEYLSVSGKRCESRHALEIHHEKPYALGGSNEASNLKVFCRNHNAAQGRWDFAAYSPSAH